MRRSPLLVLALTAPFTALISGPAAAQEARRSAGDLARQVKKALDAGKEDEALVYLKDLGFLPGREALEMLFEMGIRVQIPKLYRAITELITNRTDEESLRFFEAEARSSSEVRRIYLADLMASLKHEKAVLVLAQLAEDRNPTVLRSALAALARQRVRGSVEPLLKALERLDSARDRGQVYQETRDALFGVTGQDFDAVADWRKWWDIQKDIFDPDRKSEGATQTRKPSRDAAPEFAGKKIYGKKVVFVIDTSGTMRFVQKDDIPGLGQIQDGRDSESQGKKVKESTLTKEDDRLARYWMRIEMAKRALLKALEAFDARAAINVVEFNTKAKKLADKGLVQAQPDRKKKAMDWVRKMKWIPESHTNMKEALEEAFGVDRGITEIYLLSDGIPSADGKTNDPTEPILDRVEALNRFRKVKIHTFGFDPVRITDGKEVGDLKAANDFLKLLAQRTGGSFNLLQPTEEKPPREFKNRRPALRA